ncbi:MAG: hypothetical protein JW963_06260 [Anaerolineales bacterium]|nr:hypothetical protein [Anaerolineales bacterium]
MKPSLKNSFLFILTSLALIFSAFGVSPAYAATLTVTNTNNNGPGSLRDAILNANSGDTIVFDAALSGGTIILSSPLTLSQDVTIDGSALASQITISGGNNSGVFGTGGNSINVTLDSLTIVEGNGQGAGFNNAGTLIVRNSNFYRNISQTGNGAAIYNLFGDVEVTNSRFYGNEAENGGAIYNWYGMLTVTDSTFEDNSSIAPNRGGGAIFSIGLLTVTNSTFSLNHSSTSGGGIYHEEGNLTVANSTFYRNDANLGGGIYTSNIATIPTVKNSTFFRNSATTGGGIHVNPGLQSFNFANNIIANSLSGGDCVVVGNISPNINNLVEDGSCSASLSGDPNLGALTNNGGTTETMALLAGSPAIDAGDDTICAAVPVNNLDQRGVTRPQGAHCDIGAYEHIEPTVLSITRASTNPTDAASVDYTVTFSVPVTGVDAADFTVTKVGAGNISGMTVSGVSGSGDTYTVTVSTGTGTGRIRLDVPGPTDITDLNGNPLVNVPYATGEIYTIVRADIFRSDGPQDGWILETSENSGVGGNLNNTDNTLRVGDAALDKQYLTILSFDTSGLPDDAVITDVRLRIRRQGVVGTVNALGGPDIDIRSNMFGTLPSLQAADFQSAADAAMVLGTFDAQANDWYRAILSNTAYPFVNLTGNTQLRLYFTIDDDDDNFPDFVRIFSGDAAITNRPQLIIQYTVP